MANQIAEDSNNNAIAVNTLNVIKGNDKSFSGDIGSGYVDRSHRNSEVLLNGGILNYDNLITIEDNQNMYVGSILLFLVFC